MNLNKLKSQKGLTGIDVVIAITIISTMTIAVLAIYVNLVVGSKKNSRTSNATRIATSILQNIDSMYYADVELELANRGAIGTEKTYSNTTMFNTKIAKGYNVKLLATEYSSTTDKTDFGLKNCPLVLDVKVTVEYEVSDKKEHITLKTVKKREVLKECNEPDLEALIGKYNYGAGRRFTIKSLSQVQPIKWSMADDGYVKTNSSDVDWYNYNDKEWARVIAFESNVDNTAFSPATGVIDKSGMSSGGRRVFVWVPRCGMTVSGSKFAFAYGNTNTRIIQIVQPVTQSVSGTTTNFYYWGVKANARPSGWSTYNDETISVDSNLFPDGARGVWLDVTGGTVQGSNYPGIVQPQNVSSKLQNSKYGPIATHYGTLYY